MVQQPIAQRYIGSPIKRSEDARILTGRGRYVDDVALPGMLHAAFVRSPVAHARIVGVETAAARQAPGVVAVVTGEELETGITPGPTGIAAMMGGSGPSFSMLCTDKVRLVGDPIVMVVAASRYEAEDACELVEVDFEDLPAVASAEAALDPDSPPIFEDLGSNVLVETAPGRLRRRGGGVRTRRPGRPGSHPSTPAPERADGGSGYCRRLRPGHRTS